MYKSLLIFFCLLPLTSAFAEGLPPAFAAEYVIEKAFIKAGKAERIFRHNQDGSATYVSKSRTQGLVAFFAKEKIVETTRLQLHDGRVRPLSYEKQRDGRRKRHVLQEFDWQAGTLRVAVNDERKELPLDSLVFDQSAYQLALMVDLARGQRNLQYTIASNSRLNQHEIRFLREETIETALGELETVVVQSRDKKLKTTLWCAKSLYFLPVLIEHEEKGTDFQARLVKLSGLR